ncbi:unnamed protein product [Cyprideis torosa]|uniref:Uncharacterized protein n=1 Tax=Cyprideis torosa TaxID=163714 RepID=A0A7R8ZLX2_9CRUS|nr:unnamed protein product [Cyprideis torosa]CAG0887627.1 unnamed protein product [Cyprideis torosa]
MPCAECIEKPVWKIGNIVCGIIGIFCGAFSILHIILVIFELAARDGNDSSATEIYVYVAWFFIDVSWILHGVASIFFLLGVLGENRYLMGPYIITGFAACIITFLVFVGIVWIGLNFILTVCCLVWVIMAWCNNGVPKGVSIVDPCCCGQSGHA